MRILTSVVRGMKDKHFLLGVATGFAMTILPLASFVLLFTPMTPFGEEEWTSDPPRSGATLADRINRYYTRGWYLDQVVKDSRDRTVVHSYLVFAHRVPWYDVYRLPWLPSPVTTIGAAALATSPSATPQYPAPSAQPTSTQTTPARLRPATAASTDEMLERMSVLRELPLKSAVPVGTLPRARVWTYLSDLFDAENSQEDVDRQWFLLASLGAIRPETSLRTLLIDLMSEQLLGLYDFEGQEMKIVGGISNRLSLTDEMILSHEYVHALQDQHFALGAKLRTLRHDGTGEGEAALQALSEGDATIAAEIYGSKHLTVEQRASFAETMAISASTKLRTAPAVIRLHLLFPYVNGADFAADLYNKGGWAALDEAYADPPITTEQVMHTEKYLAREGPLEVKRFDAAAALGPNWSPWGTEETLGELGMLGFLVGAVPEDQAKRAAAGWGGDRVTLFKDTDGRKAMVIASQWDSEGDAGEFVFSLKQAFVKRGMRPSDANVIQTFFASSFGQGYIGTGPRQVVVVVTPDEATTRRVAEGHLAAWAAESDLAGGGTSPDGDIGDDADEPDDVSE